ncbi:hypothetical protein K450DRAFT_260592 [Umbelopsis ramanniana AG]|uniref:Uncharacterized protein n=1 Tax=Umbelopsis ramanniana AG TaxID=1314678 RepID=A0AAD5E396_UMBRA|nr:uncharacterized protein K450DRAFT_260592 [Umbelopsis ramanniana AG]KAI8575666.1 hypothetical protein K450DRAFT_260592 [Umbelopsis ramanniana AG]
MFGYRRRSRNKLRAETKQSRVNRSSLADHISNDRVIISASFTHTLPKGVASNINQQG